MFCIVPGLKLVYFLQLAVLPGYHPKDITKVTTLRFRLSEEKCRLKIHTDIAYPEKKEPPLPLLTKRGSHPKNKQ